MTWASDRMVSTVGATYALIRKGMLSRKGMIYGLSLEEIAIVEGRE
jgi:hypothetical protein